MTRSQVLDRTFTDKEPQVPQLRKELRIKPE